MQEYAAWVPIGAVPVHRALNIFYDLMKRPTRSR